MDLRHRSSTDPQQQQRPLHTAAASVLHSPGSMDIAAAGYGETDSALLPAEEAYWEMKLLGEAARLNIHHKLTPDLLGLFNRLVHHKAAAQCAKVQPAIDMLNARLDRIDTDWTDMHHGDNRTQELRELNARMEKLGESMVRLRSSMALAQEQGRLLGERNQQLLRENTRLHTENMRLLQQLQLLDASVQQQQHRLAPAGVAVRVSESSSPFAAEAHRAEAEGGSPR